MHLAELLALRPVPGAGVFLAVTQRCPLHCRHCSTLSEPSSPQQPAGLLRRFAESFTPDDHPEVMLLTGGEPLLRPRLVRTLAETARRAGTRSYLLTGAFFAARGRMPGPVLAAIRSVDHVAVSADVFHEAEVPRPQVFLALHEILAAGRDASIQACGTGPGDPYLLELAQQVRREFGERVPMLVTVLRPAGRSRAWVTPSGGATPQDRPITGGLPAPPHPPRAAPCDLAAWPVVGFDGTIVACCNTDVLAAGPAAGHLRLGHIRSLTWPELHRAVVASPVLRALRTRGPVQLAHRFAGRGAAAASGAVGYCGTCRSLAGRPDALRRIEAEGAGPAFALIERQAIAMQRAAGPAGFARRHGDPTRAELVLLGYAGYTGAPSCAG